MSRALLGLTFIATGLLHFARPRMYEAMMPRYLPAHRELVYASGVRSSPAAPACCRAGRPGRPGGG